MIIEPKIRGFLCTTSHPVGCDASVQEQIDYVKSKGAIPKGPKKALIIGSSAGFGLSSRITAAFGSGAGTLGLAFERPPEKGRLASPGWYQTRSFEEKAHKAGLWAKSLNGDAFSDAIKAEAVTLLKELGPVDLVVYSVAAPRRTDPKTGTVYKSCLKPIGKPYTNKTMDFNNGAVTTITLDAATQEEVDHTVGVMGGDDWELWMDLLQKEGLLAPGAVSMAYSYIGPQVTQPVYRNGTIGTAKDHLEKTALKLDERLKKTGGRAFISVNKALVTQASSAIPFMPLYISLLYKVMKAKGIHEGTLEQMDRLFRTKLYSGNAIPVDEKNRIRMDDWELREDVQSEVDALWQTVGTENATEQSDILGYRGDFHRLYGFGFKGVDYGADVPDSLIGA
ncbi:MAG: short-chain alcohol dehydrogenase family [Fibrobacteres bacterium]|nr:short-chain alcohol dehydrogenase family [Fibrobacterota bacterium]